MQFKYAIFDMDGTLLDSMHLWRQGIASYREETFGKDDISHKISAEVMNLSMRDGINYYKEISGDTSPVEYIMEYIINRVESGYKEGQPVKDGVFRLAKAFKRDGVKMCILTATPESMAKIAIEKAGLDKYFSFLISSHTMKMTKQKPEVFLYTLDKLGVDKEHFKDTLMFEDALYSIKVANSIGLHTIGLHDDFNILTREEIKVTAAEYYNNLNGFCDAHGLE